MNILLLLSFFVSQNFAIRVPIADYDVDSVRNVLARLPSWISAEFPEIQVLSAEDNGNELPEEGKARIEVDLQGRKRVIGATPTDALYAINAYLRTRCLTQISWTNASFGDACDNSGDIGRAITFKSRKLRYFGNMCTFSYSFVWWKWSDWEPFIDWIALNGFNTILMPLGQEALWAHVFTELGVNRSTLNHYFTSHAYLAWHRMGNLKGYGGGISDLQLDNDLQLAQRIVARLVALGIVPILPTFAGFVPDQMEILFNSSKFERASCWNNFSSNYSCLLTVSPTDSLFEKIAQKFLQKQTEAFGSVSSLRSADPFNELTPTTPIMVRRIAHAISTTCRQFDPNCVWVIQSWAFSYDHWSNSMIKSFLSAVPIGDLLILDLYAEITPTWLTTSSFYGHHFIWCALHNFGGSREIRGNLRHLNKGYQLALANSGEGMVGGGITMEAIDQNYIIYQFMIDRMWTNELISLNQWLRWYSASRYSIDSKITHKLWNILSQTFYDEPKWPGNKRFSVFLYQRPDFGRRIEYWFDVEKAFQSIRQIITIIQKSGIDNAHLREDISDVARAIIQFEGGNEAVLLIYEAYWLDDKEQISENCYSLMNLFKEINDLTVRSSNTWIDASKDLAGNREDYINFPRTAKDLITTWGDTGENIDYSHREWKYLVNDYYSKRWQYFCDWLLEHDSFNKTEFLTELFNNIEKPFSS